VARFLQQRQLVLLVKTSIHGRKKNGSSLAPWRGRREVRERPNATTEDEWTHREGHEESSENLHFACRFGDPEFKKPLSICSSKMMVLEVKGLGNREH